MVVALATRLLHGGVVLMLLVACQPVSPATRCANAADCPDGFVCRPDLKVCVSTRAGADGGTGADGGGIADGGGNTDSAIGDLSEHVDAAAADATAGDIANDSGTADGAIDAGADDAGVADIGVADADTTDAATAADGATTGDAGCVCTACAEWNPTVAAGGYHSCVATARDNVYCWGANTKGQIGDSNQSDHLLPSLVCLAGPGCPISDALPNIVKLAAGYQHNCGLTRFGGVLCWGDNQLGQLGATEDTLLRFMPTPVCVPGPWDPETQSCVSGAPLIGVRDIAAGANHTCLVLDDRTVRCFGINNSGQLGNGGLASSFSASGVCDKGAWDRTEENCGPGGALLGDVVELSASAVHTCARLTDGQVRCWGHNGSGQLGDGSAGGSRSNPSRVCLGGGFDEQTGLCVGLEAAPLQGVVGLAAGTLHTCAVTRASEVMCWGDNQNAQLGNATQLNSARPVTVCPWGPTCIEEAVPAVATGIVAGLMHTCVIGQAGAVYCWGQNQEGQLGNGVHGVPTCPLSDGCSHIPVGVCEEGEWSSSPAGCSGTQLDGVIALSAGNQHTCAVLGDHSVRCWGSNSNGELGDGTSWGTTCLIQQCRPNAVQSCASGAGAGCEGGSPFSLSCPPD